MGLLIGAGKGVIRTMYCNENGYADYVPVDIAVNAVLVATWNYLYLKDHEKRVYNFTSSNEFKVDGKNNRCLVYASFDNIGTRFFLSLSIDHLGGDNRTRPKNNGEDTYERSRLVSRW